jgi:chromosome segregation ATPase
MNQEKFVSAYIDLLNSTLTEAIQKNITVMAQRNVFEQELNQIAANRVNESNSLKENLLQKDKELTDLKNQLNDARRQKDVATGETNELKKNVQHIETFKSELVKARSEIDRLNFQLIEKEKLIETLINEKEKLLSRATKKEEEIKPLKKSVKKNLEQPVETAVVKDAGSF